MSLSGKIFCDGLKGKKVLIRTDGSHAIGLGHIYRMKTLALALKEAGVRVAFLTRSDRISNPLVRETGLPTHTFHLTSYPVVLKRALQADSPDLIVQDVLKTSRGSMTELRRQSGAKMINFDDVGAGLTMAEVVINSLVFHWGKYKAEASRCRLYEGPRYMILQPEINRHISFSRKATGRARNVLLTFGGTDNRFLTERVLEALRGVETPLNIRISLGPASQRTHRLEKAVLASPHRVELIQAADDLFGEFQKADLVISGGGITLYELAALGAPSVSIATERHEIYNTDYWARIGSTVSAGWEKELDRGRVSTTVSQLLSDRAKRLEMSKAGKQAVDGQGLERILKVIEELLN